MNLDNLRDVIVKQERYDELLHKEALLESVKTLHSRMTDYAFRDAVGYLLKSERKMVSGDETEANS